LKPQNITLRDVGRLFVNSLQTIVQRNHIANFLGILLIILTVSVAAAGYMTYRKLNDIVVKLETGDHTNSNLLQYKEILVNLHDMENHVESFDLTNDPDFIEKYNLSITRVFDRVDSLNKLNPEDKELLLLNDSLGVLINEKTLVLNELIDLKSDSISDELTELEGFISQVTETQLKQEKVAEKKNTSVQKIETEEKKEPEEEPKKKGFFKRLFAKKPDSKPEAPEQEISLTTNSENSNQDSVLAIKSKIIQHQINTKVDELRSSQKAALQENKERELNLLSRHYAIQNQIMDLVTYLEGRETVKMKIRSLKAQELAATTNEQITLFFSLATILLFSSVVVMIVYVRRNVKYQQLLRESKNSAEILAKAKERFFANMSHEIRTPMNAISGFTKVLLKTDLSYEQKDHLEIIDKSSEHLLHLLNDILDFSKLQAEKLQLEKSSFSLEQVCEESIRLLEDSAKRKGLTLTKTLENIPDYVEGDPYRLRQILLNLLNNGIKYTEKGEVSLHVNGVINREHVKLSIAVKDTGVGIPKEKQFRLFREFEQADQSSFSKGTGLGLAITKRLVILHDGKIKLDSKEGEGTTVKISLTYPLAEKPTEATPENHSHGQFEGLRVLVADDEPFNTKLLATILSRKGISYDEAFDGEEALDKAEKQKYDLLLLDLKMPKLTGWEVASKVKNGDGPNSKTPMIALTATVTRLDQEKGSQVGFNHLMRKPFDENELFDQMGQLLNLKTPEPADSAGNQFEADLTTLRQMGDEAFVAEMVNTYIISAEDGMKQLKLMFEQENFPEVAMIAHKIVAPSRHFKATKLVQQLKDVELEAETDQPKIHPNQLEAIETELNQVIASLKAALKSEVASS